MILRKPIRERRRHQPQLIPIHLAQVRRHTTCSQMARNAGGIVNNPTFVRRPRQGGFSPTFVNRGQRMALGSKCEGHRSVSSPKPRVQPRRFSRSPSRPGTVGSPCAQARSPCDRPTAHARPVITSSSIGPGVSTGVSRHPGKAQLLGPSATG
jgi:hypothetical protein